MKQTFLLDYERLIVVLTISLLPRQFQKEIIIKFNTIEVRQTDLREWLNGRTVWNKEMYGFDKKNMRKVYNEILTAKKAPPRWPQQAPNKTHAM